ncbi:hypothetical protein CPB84DRAFT_617802 [Gymnopilus junonius]|uniref:NAD(P)-binding protein n=1 Tax=Gymnopilus junonius TaxID=109634 RepID=A0A9P5NQP0_GYMJU|nr:hypothetical protein CPB84DRAFT_617802 [Gymnopilus junonius]
MSGSTQQPQWTFVKLSTADNPLTCVIPQNLQTPPAARAIERFAINGNAIVTGGAGDLGLEAARALLEHGATGLAIFDLPEALEKHHDKIVAMQQEFQSVKVLELPVDVSDEGQVVQAVEKTVGELDGGVHVLVCFAGIARGGEATEMSVDLWRKVQEVNTMGAWICARTVAKEMIKQKSGGSIIFVASIAAHKVLFPLHQSVYNVSKAGLLQLTACLAAEWAQHGIRVNSISPGFMDTVMTQGEGPAVGRKVWEERNPLGRMGDATEVTGPVVMLASNAGRYVNGIDILIDGGGHVF